MCPNTFNLDPDPYYWSKSQFRNFWGPLPFKWIIFNTDTNWDKIDSEYFLPLFYFYIYYDKNVKYLEPMTLAIWTKSLQMPPFRLLCLKNLLPISLVCLWNIIRWRKSLRYLLFDIRIYTYIHLFILLDLNPSKDIVLLWTLFTLYFYFDWRSILGHHFNYGTYIRW